MTRANTLPIMLTREMPLYVLQSFLSPWFLYGVIVTLSDLAERYTYPLCSRLI